MIGQLASAGMKIGGAIAGGIMKRKALKEQKKMLERQQKENQDWYNRRYNEDATQRADAQALLTKTEDSIRQRNAAAAGTQAVMGGTEESVAAAKAANNQALTSAVSNINVAADARKDNIESQYLQTKQSINNQMLQLQKDKMNNIDTAVAGVQSAASDISKSGLLDNGNNKG